LCNEKHIYNNLFIGGQMTDKAAKYLLGMPHFSFLPDEEIHKISSKVLFKHYEKGMQLALKDETVIDSVYAVKKGSLSLFDLRDGESVPSGFIKSGEVFGGITILMNGGVSLRTVIVEEDCSGYEIPKNIFQDLCARYPQFYEFFLENFSKHIFDDSIKALIETGQARHFLSGIEPFSFLPEELIADAINELTVVQHPKGRVLFVQGRSRVGHIYIVQRGSAERYFEDRGKKTMLGMLGEGDIYGGISMLLNDGLSVRTLKVTGSTVFYLIPKKVFLKLCEANETFTDYFTDTFGKRMLERSYAAIIAKTIQPQEEGLVFFNQPISSISTKMPIFGNVNLSIREAATKMSRENISSLFIKDSDGQCTGVITEKDLTKKVIALGYDTERPVAEIMSSPIETISHQALIFEVLMRMMKSGIRHIAITNENEQIVGILSNRDILTAQGQSPVFLVREIATANSMEEIVDRHNKLPKQIMTLISSGANAKNLTRFITTISDTILNKIIGFALMHHPPPPARFVFMILGSEGRSEQTLKTDQDNAIIFEDVPEESQAAVQEYFLKFGETVCTLLDDAGYTFCNGDVMAKNPKWCQPLAQWKNNFSKWIHAAEGEDLLQASIFFDFRAGYGDEALVDSLRGFLFRALDGWPGFMRHLTENAMYFRPPIGFFKNFVVESKGKHRDMFDIKSAMTPIVDFARVYALKNHINETNTMERLHQLHLKGILQFGEYEELEKAYSFLLQLRFVCQVTAIVDDKDSPHNFINPKKLTRIEQKMLKEIFSRIEKFQAKLEFDFIGRI
jgi:CBS domain-containing protein